MLGSHLDDKDSGILDEFQKCLDDSEKYSHDRPNLLSLGTN